MASHQTVLLDVCLRLKLFKMFFLQLYYFWGWLPLPLHRSLNVIYMVIFSVISPDTNITVKHAHLCLLFCLILNVQQVHTWLCLHPCFNLHPKHILMPCLMAGQQGRGRCITMQVIGWYSFIKLMLCIKAHLKSGYGLKRPVQQL